MAKLLNGAFDANMFNPTQGMGSLPIGRHLVSIVATHLKENSNKDGGYVQFDLKAADGSGEQAYRLNLYHSNPQTVDIANKQLSALCHVTGVFFIEDTDQLIGPQFYVEIGKQKTGDYVEVKKVYDINGNEPGKEPTNQGGNQQQGNQGNQQQQGANNGGWGGNNSANQGGSPQQNNAPQGGNNGNNGGGGWGGNNQGNNGGDQGNHGGNQGGGGQQGGWGGNNQNQNQAPQGNNGGNGGGGWNANQAPNNAGGNPGWGNKG